jgi:DNA-binding response OmpR family regulator
MVAFCSEMRYNSLSANRDRKGRAMGRNASARSVQILCIGRADPNYDKVWQGFQQDGILVAFATTQTMGLQMARDLRPNIVVVNTANSHFSGVYLCKILGRRLPGAQRVAITERGEGEGIVCEQRLVRPFTTRKLRDTLWKMIETTVPHKLNVGPVELDQVSRLVSSPQGRHHLTPKQCDLLAMFMQRPNQVISRRELMEQIWKTGYLGDTRTLDVHVRWLREKIELDPDHPVVLVTKRGIGYVLVAPWRDISSEESSDSPD